ncbi:MAG: ABC transporter ATP-binding protein [Magnetococcales bacterium]|nr:ABC transporter ATP-binding protein [Magnetococcales bacterium]
MMGHLLELKKVNTSYGPIQALRDVSLHVDSGEIVTLIGANGAGKSTLLMTIFGNPAATSGHILYNGQEISQIGTHRVARHGISQVPEGRRIFPGMTVMENLKIGLMPIEKNKELTEKSDQTLEEILTQFPRMRERANQRAGTLSGGEQQMLAIGRALMSHPQLLLLDEPSLGLAPKIVHQIFETLREISTKNTTIFLVEQNANQALRLADRGYVLVNGQVTLSGTGSELLENPDIRKAYLGGH